MKKFRILGLVSAAFFGALLSAQSINVTTAGVGIGTTAPSPYFGDTRKTLHVNGGSSGAILRLQGAVVETEIGESAAHTAAFFFTRNLFPIQFGTNNVERLRISELGDVFINGNVGIGMTMPTHRLTITGPAAGAATGVLRLSTSGNTQGERCSLSMYATFQNTTDNAPRRTVDMIAGYDASAWGAEYLAFNVGGAGDNQAVTSEKMRIRADGMIGIGTSSPTHTLTVAGTVKATNFLRADGTWADFVFQPDYKLAPLSDVEAHIKENGHLPGIPSADEVKANGVDIGDMQVRLLAKIEELTLHMIEHEKVLAELKKENADLRYRLTSDTRKQ